MRKIKNLENIVKNYQEKLVKNSNFNLDLENFLGNLLIACSDLLKAERLQDKVESRVALTRLWQYGLLYTAAMQEYYKEEKLNIPIFNELSYLDFTTHSLTIQLLELISNHDYILERVVAITEKCKDSIDYLAERSDI